MGRERFVGTWKLLSWESRLPDGTVTRAWGEAPLGVALFTTDGYAAAQLMRRGRPHFISDQPFRATADEASETMSNYVAYYGKYEIDEANKTLVTHVEGSLLPNWIGATRFAVMSLETGNLSSRHPPVPSAARTLQTN